jgi:hypothetical protein
MVAPPGTRHYALVPTEWMDKPWYPGRPTAVVLYSTPEGWRFALTTERRAIVDGTLGQPELSAVAAQHEMLRRLRQTDEVELDGSWTTTQPGWWSANLRPVG